MNIESEEFAQQGWQCPICKRVYSPFTPMCYYCGNDKQTTVTSTGTDINPSQYESTNKKQSAIYDEINSGIICDMEPRKKFCD